ncbi:ROK family protein [Actinoallomurus rhizosphaericola]|uniref:ROK family protein n=1 Tax=Actinoallomurus rhizosphaericola TaxID=2952536 RepID=UPI0020920C30|nr:ROK family protein [Actinoallomurus rhizosphaericola]MCO5998095.1 ROK family protein [Actinoallomurus rhizosphaericola]
MNQTTEPASIVVDMGGTTTRVGAYRDGWLTGDTVRFATPKPAGGRSVREEHLDRIAAEVDRMRKRHPAPDVREVGVAVGATVDSRGRIRNASLLWNEPGTGFDLGAALARRLDWARITVCNDIAAAAWRYQDLGRFALLTISTGVAIKVFDARLPFAARLLLDDEGLGGEIGHVRVDPERRAPHRTLGRAAAAGDLVARARLGDAGLRWCECGTVGDLCAHASGPATVRAAAALARSDPGLWDGSGLAGRCEGDPEKITAPAIAAAAQTGDAFTRTLLSAATRPLAAQILQLSAALGLRTFVVMGGFANGVGEPWFAELRANLADLLPDGGWFTGWTDADVDALARPSRDRDDSLIGMGCLLAERRTQVREVHKPVGEARALLRHRSAPRCGRRQFAVRMAFAGICGTDLQVIRGDRGCEPGIPGHECVAQVTEVGADVSGVSVGDVIGVNPNRPDDEHDKFGHNLPGVFRERVVWDEHLIDRGQIIPLPAAGLAEWTLLEPLSTVVRSARAGRDRWRDRRVLIVGAGVSGLLHAMLARHDKARRVLVANRSPQRLELAVERGILAPEDCLALDGSLPAAIAEATGGAGVDVVVLAVPRGTGPAILNDLWPGVADGATVHLFGGFHPGSTVRLPGGEQVAAHPIRVRGERHRASLGGGRECTLVGSSGADREDYQRARDLCVAGEDRLDLAPLISHVVSLDATPEVLRQLMSDGRLGGRPALRVIIDFSLTGDVVRAVDGRDLPRIGVRT